MTAKTKTLIAVNIILIATLACNLPGGQNNSNLAQTITAQAMTAEAMLSQMSSGTPVPLDTSVPASTGTLSAPEVSVTSTTNCRTGPSTAYDLVFTMNPGQTAQVVGKNTPTNYWIINNPAGGTCWLWGQYAVVSGGTANLPEYPPPPTPTAKFTKTPKPTATFTPPKDPSSLSSARYCEAYMDGLIPKWSEKIILAWQDNANNETGYRVYKNGSPLPDFPANTTSYQITLRYNQGTGGPLWDNFGVEAFNDAGSSARPAIDVARCP